MLWKNVFLLAAILTIQVNAFSGFFLDFFRYYGEHFKITICDCNKKESVLLSKPFISNGYASKMLSVNTEHLVYPIPPYRQFFVVNLECQHSLEVLKKANQEKLFASPFRWLGYHQKTSLQELLEYTFLNLSILVDSDFNVAELHSNGHVFIRKIVKKHPRENEFSIEDFAIWNSKLGFSRHEHFESKVTRRRKNLGVVLNTCLVITHNDSLNHLTDKRDKHIDSIAKVDYVLVLILASVYNISLNFSIRDTWGYKNNQSQWSGMMGELTRKEADIGGTSLFLIKERIDLIDYIAMITPTRSKFVFRQPKLSYITNVYTLPFDDKVWYSTIFMVAIMIFALFGLMKWEWAIKKLLKVENPSNSLELKDSLPEVAFMTFGAVCQQGAVALPYSTPGRIATIFLLISLMFIYVSYSANIVALLQTSSNSIRTLEDLLKSRIDIGVDDTVYNRFYFSTADEPIRKAIYQKKVSPPGKPANYMPIEEGVKRVRDGLYAFHMETGAGYKLVSETFREDEKCGLQEIPYIQVVDPWLAIQKNSSYKEMLKIGLRLLRENGVQQRENNLIYTRKPICTSKSSTFFSVGIVDCYPAAAILAGGIAASAVVFVLEIYLHNRIRFYKKQWHQHFDQPTYETERFQEDLIYQFLQTVSKAQNLQLFTTSHHWILLINSSTGPITTNFPINSNVVTFERNDNGVSIKKIYRPSRNSSLVQHFMGHWKKDEGYSGVCSIHEERQKRQLLGEEIKISYVVEDMDTVSHLEDYQYNILIDAVTKFNYALMQHLIDLVNASKTEIFRRYFVSTQIGNDTFTGMLDDLNKDFDIGGTPIKFLSDRVNKFDFLAKTAKLEKKFVFRATPHSYISNVFTLPFDSFVWYSCFGLMATIFFVAYLVVYWEWKDPIFRTYLSPQLCLRPHPVDIFLMEVGSAAQQGFESEPRSNSGRIVFIFTLISLMFLYTSFSANIVALLQSTTESVNSLENLLESRIPVGYEGNISMKYFEELNYQKKSQEFYDKIQKPLVLPIKEGVKRVQEEFFAFYADTAKIYKHVKDWFLESEKCGLREIPFKNTHVDYWLVIRKNSTYKDIFRVGMFKIHESGLRSREHRRLFMTKPDCDSAGGNFESVGLVDSYGAFLVMGAGIAVSLMLFVVENIVRKYKMAEFLKNNEDLDFIGDDTNKYSLEDNALKYHDSGKTSLNKTVLT